MFTLNHRRGLRRASRHALRVGICSLCLVAVAAALFATTSRTPTARAAQTRTLSDPILFVPGFNQYSQIDCNATWINTLNYLKTGSFPLVGGGRAHPGLGGDTLIWNGQLITIGLYNNNGLSNTHCTSPIATNTSTYFNRCDGYPGGLSNSDSWVGTNNEPIEHMACELAWYIADNYPNQNIDIVAHSMGGIVTRYMLLRVNAQNDGGHFPPKSQIHVLNVVTFSTPHGGITHQQFINGYFGLCPSDCYQLTQMIYDPAAGDTSYLMVDLQQNGQNPQGTGGTDWTMMGSLAPTVRPGSTDACEPFDWYYQSTFMDGGHRIGFDYPIPGYYGLSGNWIPANTIGYCHGDYMSDQSDRYDASYYYCDFCTRHTLTTYSANNTPHSLHNMLLALIYYGW